MVKLSDDQKREYLNGTIFYEATELFNGLQFLLYNNKLLKDNEVDKSVFTINNNIAIEHILLHARSFDEFFFRGFQKGVKNAVQQPHGNNVKAVDYITTWRSTQKSKSIKRLERWVNIQVHHMDWRRLTVKYQDKVWDLALLVKDFLIIIKNFIKKVNKKYHSVNIGILMGRIDYYISVAKKEELLFKTVKTGVSVTFI